MIDTFQARNPRAPTGAPEQSAEIQELRVQMERSRAEIERLLSEKKRVEGEMRRIRTLAQTRARTTERIREEASRLGEVRDYLAQQLTRAFHRPLRPVRHFITYHALSALSAFSAPFSDRTAARFSRSAQKRSPSRFDVFLDAAAECPAFAGSRPDRPGRTTRSRGKYADRSILLPEDERQLTAADVAGLSLPVSDDPLVSVIIPSYGKPWLTLQCLKSIAEFPPKSPFEVIVADNASGDPGVELLRNVRGLRLEINETNLGFLRSCNRTARLAKGKHLLFLNNDTLMTEGWLEPLLAVLDRFPDAGLVGSKLLFPDGSLQEAGGIVWNDGSAWNYGRDDNPDRPEYNYVREADYISGCAILVPRALWEELEGFDEYFAPGYCEDSDLAFRIRAAGRKVYYCPGSVVFHLEGVTHGKDVRSGVKAYQLTNTKKFRERWRDVLLREHFLPGVEIARARDRNRDRKIALVIDHYIPQPDQDAGSRTILAMIESLQAEGYLVKFWPDNLVCDPAYTPALQSSGVEVFYGEMSFKDWIKENGAAVSLAIVSRPAVALRHIGPLRVHSDALIAYYGHDLHFQRMRMQAEISGDSRLASDAIAMEEIERSIWERVDVALYPSQEEAELAGSVAEKACSIIPYAFDEFGRDREPPRNHDILFVAGFAHPPNTDAAVWLVEDVFPRIREKAPDARLSLVGANPTEAVRSLASEDVEVTGHVTEEELRARYARARVVLVPLRAGAGVKSKVVEALREGAPLVTTRIGAQGLDGLEEVAEVSDEASGLADAALKLLLDDRAWKNAALRQVDYARKRFSRAAFRQSFLEAVGVSPALESIDDLSAKSPSRRGVSDD